MRQILLQDVTAILLQNATEIYYKMRQDLHYKMRQFCITKCDSFITKCDSCYKLRRLLLIATVQAA